MGYIGTSKNFASSLLGFFADSKVRGTVRFSGISGIFLDIFVAAFNQNWGVAAREVAMLLTDISSSIGADMAALEAGGLSTWMFFQHTLSVYAKLWLLLFAAGVFAAYARGTFVPKDMPTVPLWMWYVIPALTVWQVTGMLANVVFFEGSLHFPWVGVGSVFVHGYDVWVQPAVSMAQGTFVEETARTVASKVSA